MSNETLTSMPLAIIADDEELGRVLLAESAAAVGLTAQAFDNGLDALQAALQRDVAIVLLDVDMPGMDGYEVCRRLRLQSRYATVPIIMVTGREDAAGIARAFDAGATDFISKPVNWALLPHRLEYILRNAATAARIEHLAYFDTLTQLPNRQRCLALSTEMLAQATERAERVAVVWLDLSSLKRVNDSFGHAMGDAVLNKFAERLKETAA